jgi:hypothetical protein
MTKIATLKKPTLNTEAVRAFAEGATGATGAPSKAGRPKATLRSENAPAGFKSGLIPEGDQRLTANIRSDLHLKLKIRAATERTTVGELIEQWVESWKP